MTYKNQYIFEKMFNIINNQKSKNKNEIVPFIILKKKKNRVILFNSGNFRQGSGKMKLSYCIDSSRNWLNILRDFFESSY